VIWLHDWCFRFSVSRKNVGLMIHRLKSFVGSHFTAHFTLAGMEDRIGSRNFLNGRRRKRQNGTWCVIPKSPMQRLQNLCLKDQLNLFFSGSPFLMIMLRKKFRQNSAPTISGPRFRI
jgi:hypothetical protein